MVCRLERSDEACRRYYQNNSNLSSPHVDKKNASSIEAAIPFQENTEKAELKEKQYPHLTNSQYSISKFKGLIHT